MAVCLSRLGLNVIEVLSVQGSNVHTRPKAKDERKGQEGGRIRRDINGVSRASGPGAGSTVGTDLRVGTIPVCVRAPVVLRGVKDNW